MAYAHPISKVTKMTEAKRERSNASSLLRLKQILLDEAMKLEGNDADRAKELMEEIMNGIEKGGHAGERAFRPPRPKRAG